MTQSQKLMTRIRAKGKLDRIKLRKARNYLFVAPAVIFIVLFMIYPLLYNFYISVRDVNVGTLMSGNAPFVGLRNYKTMIGDPTFWHSLLISFIFTGGSLLFQFTIGFALALFFQRPFPGGGIMRAFLLLGWLMPIVVSASIWKWLLDGDYGVINYLLQGLGLLRGDHYWLSEPNTALAGVIVANIWLGIPFNALLLLTGLQGISLSLYEAARVDGANAWQRFLYITLPQMRSVSLTVLLLGFIYTFKVFDLIFVMTGGGPANATTTLPILTYNLTFEFYEFGTGAAAASLLLMISLALSVVYLLLVRREEAA
jgi:multiple sugar transport system permease protein